MDWKGRLFIGLLHFFAWWPLRVNQAMGAGIGYLLWWLPTGPKRISEINLRIAFPEMSDAERRPLLKNSLIELGKTMTELGPMWLWDNDKVLGLIRSIDGDEAVMEACHNGGGAIVMSPHLGNWEITGLYWAVTHPSTTLYRPPNLPSIEAFMRRVRGRGGNRLVPTDLSGVKALHKALLKGEIAGLLPDQDPGKSGGVYAPFFGHPARTMVLVSRLAAKTGCGVFFSFAERLPKGQGYHLHIIPAEAEVAERDEVMAAKALNQGLETCVKRFPEQYQWSYKRYKHPPEGVVDVYKK